MEFSEALKRIYYLYTLILKKKIPIDDLGLYFEQYRTISGSAILLSIIEKPTSNPRGKVKLFQKVMLKSKRKGTPIIPKEFILVRNYFASNFQQIKSTKNQIIQTLELIIAGLRLEFLPFNNLKYEFTDTSNPKIIIYDSNFNGKLAAYISIVDLKENGLYLAHERQIEYIIQEIKNGNAPDQIANLPPIRTGETTWTKIQNRRKNNHNNSDKLNKFKQQIQINQEMSVSTSKAISPNIVSNEKEEMKNTINFNGSSNIFQKPVSRLSQIDQTQKLDNEKLMLENSDNEKLMLEIVDLKNQLSRSINQNSILETQNMNWQTENQNLQIKVDRMEDEIQNYYQQFHQLQQQYSQNLRQKTQEIAQFQAFLSQSNNQNSSELIQYQETCKELLTKIQIKDEKITELNENIITKIQEKDGVIQDLEEQLSFVSNLYNNLKENNIVSMNTSMNVSKQLDDAIEILVKEKEIIQKENVRLKQDFESRLSELMEENEILAIALKKYDEN